MSTTAEAWLEADTSGRVRVARRVPPAAADVLALARLAAVLAPQARIIVRGRRATVEATCGVEVVDAVAGELGGAWPPAAGAVPPVEELRVGILGVALPPRSQRLFLRLAASGPAVVDRARATYLLVANAALEGVTGGWIDGPGVVVDPAADDEVVRAEVYEIGRALRALADERIAESYLELCGIEPVSTPPTT